MPCPNCGQPEGWTKTMVGWKDNIRDHGDRKECKNCGHVWPIRDETKSRTIIKQTKRT